MVNQDGWTLKDEEGHSYTFPLSPRRAFHGPRPPGGVTDVFQDRRAYVLNNDHDTAMLRNDRGRFVDEVSGWVATASTATDPRFPSSCR
ncbi:lamin tail domain-containing protein [Streptomyces sp. NPDC003720]|uniref:lamin tail domain-containing protein n=1 Tax=Streptomyces sp. NPDC003720 TaxID=3364684 RepID=UPI003677E5F6